MIKNILVTGCCGFIGSHLVRQFANKYPEYNIYGFDKMTYCGNKYNVSDVIENTDNFFLLEGDICSEHDVNYVFDKYDITDVIHLAAESHVDNSISNPLEFVITNVVGTVNLLNAAKNFWKDNYSQHLFYHVSTDEVYGALDFNSGCFYEDDKYNPHSPYSASKASSDHFVRAYSDTYGLNIIVSNCSNNFGPNQYREKLIPKTIECLMNNKEIPIYGDGKNIRDWISVYDHVNAIDNLFHYRKIRSERNDGSYNIGANNEWANIDLVKLICGIFANIAGVKKSWCTSLIKFVEDRPGHDKRYAINADKIYNVTGWEPTKSNNKEAFKSSLEDTIRWYFNLWNKPENWYNNDEFKK